MIKQYEHLKETNVFWLGDIPSHWQKIKIKRLAKVKNGKDQKEITIEAGGYPAYGTGGIIGRVSDFLYDKDTVLLGRKGTIDRPQFITEPFWVVDTAFYTEINDEVNAKFFYYLSLKIPFDLLQESSAVPSMTQEKLNNVFVCKPTLCEQNKIVEFLDYRTGVIDKLIAKKERLIDLLKEKRQAVINEAVTKGLDPNAKMKDSGIEWLGEVPEGWDYKKLSYNTYMKGRIGWQGLKHEEFIEEGPYLITGMNFKDGVIRWNEVYHISEERYEEAPEIQLKDGDVLMTKDGTIGKLLFIENLPGPTSLNSHLLVLRPTDNSYIPKFLYYQLMTELFQVHIELNKTGTTFYGITQEAMGRFKILLPSINEQNKIVNFIEKSNTQIDNLSTMILKQIDNLKEYRQSIISEAVTGKIDVREWEPPIKNNA